MSTVRRTPIRSFLGSPSTIALAGLAFGFLATCLSAAGVLHQGAGVGAALIGAAVAAAAFYRLEESRRELRVQLDGTAEQLDRRISELFSLQELSYVLSESMQLDRVVEQVVRYAQRFLRADGALVALTDGGNASRLRIAAAVGSLTVLRDRVFEPPEHGLVRVAITRERIEVAQGMTAPSVPLVGSLTVRSAAVAPLRSQGVSLGVLAVVDRSEGQFTTEDLWLLSTVATQTSVAVANSRLFEMVRRSKEEWETAFNALTEGIAVVAPDGKIVRANRAFAALAGQPEQELVGQEFLATIAPDSTVARALLAAVHRRERPAPVEIRPDPGRRVLRLTAAPLSGPAAGDAAVLLVEDVTEQRTMEAQLIQNEKMASIGQLVSGVAHELNNPLTSIAGLAELLLEPHLQLPNGTKDHLRVIRDQAERAGRIVRNLLTFARQGTPEKEPVDLNDVVARTALLISYELKLRGIELESRRGPEPVFVLGDRYELQQVLLNLVTNAVQAVSELPPDRPRRITLVTEAGDGQATLRISDTGPGVPPALVPHLFTPFFTTKGPGQGTGLGLSLSYGLVESHGGKLRYQPAAEGGAEFVITLPLHTGPVPAPPAAREGARASPTRGVPRVRRILVVDDDPAVHRLVSALFAPDGYTVEAVRQGEQGLKLAKGEAYDLIIADAQAMAGPDRLFASALLATDPRYRERLVVAAAPRTSGPQLSTSVHVVPKPFNLRELRALASRIFAAAGPAPAPRGDRA